MSELAFTALRLGLLVLLWVLVLSVVGVLRGDIFGARSARAAAPAGPQRRDNAPPPPREDRGSPRAVVVVEGPLRGTSLTLASSPVVIGRSPDSTLVLDDDYASGRHARLFPQDGAWWVEDLGSTNGTLLGRDQLGAATPVRAGAQLRIGRTVLELRR
ncbi:FHA domain-containing protein FhaB/FipA [Pseudokineococcus sp. 1T1Z-3]|uniref:FHA domain-containing protein FhaB/FipA n=1 Tax=Pseudokineococcus sp. 1T1Z-3 TaxID=3132745 RepID=UPI0030969C31